MNDLREQFSFIYDQYIEKIYRFVYLKVNSQEIAEDVTSGVFLKGWESYKKNQKIDNPKAFLYKIARNMVIDYYRVKDRTSTISVDSIPQLTDQKTDVHEKAILNADIELVKSAIYKLDKDYQDVIIWYYLEDMPASEIAELLGKPHGTIRVMIHRGLESLKNELRDAG